MYAYTLTAFPSASKGYNLSRSEISLSSEQKMADLQTRDIFLER